MAIFIPSIEKIMQFTVKPEPGELHMLSFLEKTLDDSFEVFFNPYMNGDRPDIVIIRKDYGVLIIEVKDWDLDLYEVNEKKHWKLKTDKNAYPKSPIEQVLKYKTNLFELHIDKLLEMKIKNIKSFNIVACAVYFHNATTKQIEDKLINRFENDSKYQNFLKYNIDLIGRYDDTPIECINSNCNKAYGLNEFDFNALLYKRYLKAQRTSLFFTESIYNSFKSFMYPTDHVKEDGIEFRYTREQYEIIYATAPNKQQRIKGVFGSGKTTVLAARAVQAYIRLRKSKRYPQILILTYNITLKNFIHDKLSKVRENFPWSAFVINNYHEFINSELNNLGIQFEKEKISDLESNYYSNKQLFVDHKSQIVPYDAIFIDEIQDYHRMWMEIIKECFLAKDGEYVLFGDVKQNIYGNETESKDVKTNVIGQPKKLQTCFRSEYKIKDLAVEYQKNIFKDKYETDNLKDGLSQGVIDFKKLGEVEYQYLDNEKQYDSVRELYHIIEKQIQDKNNTINRNDITVLGYTINFLRDFEAYYRCVSNAKTTTMFETIEIMYLKQLNYISNNNEPQWFKNGLNLIDNNIQHLAHLFALYDLYTKFPNEICANLSSYCEKYGTDLQSFENYIEYFKNIKVKENAPNNEIKNYDDFLIKVYGDNYDSIRNNKKIHFWMNTGAIKISTVHSFKGWETEMLFLIVEKRYEHSKAFDELIYTGLTRCKSKLFIINFEETYDYIIKSIVRQINSH